MNDESDIIDLLGIEAHIRAEVFDAVPEIESSWESAQESDSFQSVGTEQFETWVRRTLAACGGSLGAMDDNW